MHNDRPTCSHPDCPKPVKYSKTKAGKIRYYRQCHSHYISACPERHARHKAYHKRKWIEYSPVLKYKQSTCAHCGFEGHPCQMDVDHIDENKNNNDPANYQTLCANCHRLKSWMNRKHYGTHDRYN